MYTPYLSPQPFNPSGHNTKRGKWQPFVSMSELMENYRLWALTGLYW